MITVLALEDDVSVLQGWRQLLEATEDIRVVGMEAAIRALNHRGHYFRQNIAVVAEAYLDQNVCDD